MLDILKRFLYTRNEYDKKHLPMDWNLDVRPDSDHTVLFPPLSRPEIKRLQRQLPTAFLHGVEK